MKMGMLPGCSKRTRPFVRTKKILVCKRFKPLLEKW